MSKSMTRKSFLGVAGIVAATLSACGQSGASTDAGSATDADGVAVSGTYAQHIQGFDWGCGVDKVTISLDTPLDAVEATDLAVTETKMATDWTDETFPVVETTIPRTVTAATLSDDGKTLELDLACVPDDGDSPLVFDMSTWLSTWSDPYYLTIGLSDGAALTSEGSAVASLNIATEATETTTSADTWTFDSFAASDGVTYQYAAWSPEEGSKTLVVWLHGLGEGGTEDTDPRVTILGNKVVALSEDAFQEAVGGAHVLAPQCPTYWMDADGQKTNFNGGAIEADGSSFYTASTEEFIDAYAQQVGADKVVLTGCSNGGFMTMVLALSRPDAYAGVVPICEALPDAQITDEQIASLTDLPMYFVYSEDDTTVDPTKHEIPTIERLKKAGKASDTLHVSTTEHVVDTSGQFFATDEDGNEVPYQYAGHWSWIYFDNNECACDEDGMAAWDFIAECVK